jgi:hypothetical protein
MRLTQHTMGSSHTPQQQTHLQRLRQQLPRLAQPALAKLDGAQALAPPRCQRVLLAVTFGRDVQASPAAVCSLVQRALQGDGGLSAGGC